PRAEVDARDLLQAQRAEYPYARASAAAHVEPVAERPESRQDAGGRGENPVRRAKGRVVELRSQQVVAALDRGQRLDAELPQRRALWREHTLRLRERSDRVHGVTSLGIATLAYHGGDR